MNIQIGNDYKITSDAYNIIVNERREYKEDTEKHKKGDKYWQSVSYHPNLEQACKSLLDRQLKQSEIDTVFGLKQLIIEATREIVEAVKVYGQANNPGNTTKSECLV